jgi:glycerophosphoryl diester phosphodiesterase
MPRHSIFGGTPLLIAHRGGSALAPENTLTAFRSAAVIWGADMIELDVHATADGHCVVIHDATVDRTTDGSGAVAALTLAEVQALDAGYRFTRDAGATYPFRSRGVSIPTIEQVLEALPNMRFTVEVKAAAAQAPLFAAVERLAAHARVVVAAMHERDRTQFGTYPGPISASFETLKRFYRFHRLGLGRFAGLRADAVHVPEDWDGRRLVTPRFVRDLKTHDIPVIVWTVNDGALMRRLLEWGVGGIVTDRLDILGRLLHELYDRPLAPGNAAITPAG